MFLITIMGRSPNKTKFFWSLFVKERQRKGGSMKECTAKVRDGGPCEAVMALSVCIIFLQN